MLQIPEIWLNWSNRAMNGEFSFQVCSVAVVAAKGGTATYLD